MKVALVGSSGYIAGFLLDRMENLQSINSVIKIDMDETADEILNLETAEQFNYEVLRGVDTVVFTAAISGPDKCAQEYEYCWKVNVDGTKYFIQRAMDIGCKVLFFSSDAVFGDKPGHIYTELSETRAGTAYGKMKKAIEDEFLSNSLFKTIRLSYVVSKKDRFVTYCFECMKNGKVAEVYHPFYRNCIVVSDVVEAVTWLLINWQTYLPAVLNVAGSELVSRLRIVDEINRSYANKLEYVVMKPNLEFFANRPPITQMKSLYLTKYKILDETSFTEKIQNELKG